jgi:hypothetical protein
MKYARVALIVIAVSALLVLTSADAAAQRSPEVASYSLQTTGNVQLSLPVVRELSEVLYRDVTGGWSPLDVNVIEDALQLRIEVSKIKNGRTMVILNIPRRVNLDDIEPPYVVSFQVDERNYGPVETVALGGVEMAPRSVRLEVKDELNMLRTSSLAVSVNGRRYKLRDAGVELERISSRHAVITLDVNQLLQGMSSDNTISIGIDDYAVDQDALNTSLSFRYTPPYTCEDGTKIAVDSVTGSSGWSQWWVLVDGVKMDTSYGTTAGYTWLSDQNAQAHWVRIEFPKPREVSGVAIWWAFYECYRTSVAYKVQTWDGDKWVTQTDVKDQTERQCSEHTFAPVTTTAVRVWQPPMSGHAGRAEYMWVSEIEVL